VSKRSLHPGDQVVGDRTSSSQKALRREPKGFPEGGTTVKFYELWENLPELRGRE
jgi:hypothetical protein